MSGFARPENRSHGIAPLSRATPAPQTKSQTDEAEFGNIADSKFTHDFTRMQAGTLADWLPQARSGFRVVPSSPLADGRQANAVTTGESVHLSSHWDRFEPREQQRILAHESIHAAQQSADAPYGTRESLEAEAQQLTPQVLRGESIRPQLRAHPFAALADTGKKPEDGGPLPNDTAAVERAKARKEVLLRWKAIYEGSKNDPREEKRNVLDKRQALDNTMSKRLQESEKLFGQKPPAVDDYRKHEDEMIAKLNRLPVKLDVTKDAVRVHARFQVRFEGRSAKEAQALFPKLKSNFEKGVASVWNQALTGSVLKGRSFELVPEFTLVQENAKRDPNFWLITVRKDENGPMRYGKTDLNPQNPGAGSQAPEPVNVTDPSLDSGVMSLLPSAVDQPMILGHESLHLFGLADRYMDLPVGGRRELFGLRDTKGRDDPLGADADTGAVKGKILEEDLGFVLDKLGVYPEESEADVNTELQSVDKIIQSGRDPNSLIHKRGAFDDKMIQQTEDLP